MHRHFDWLHRLEVSIADSADGALRMGEVVEDLRSGVLHRGAAVLESICRAVPLYAPLRLLLRIPAVRQKVEREMNGDCGGEACRLCAGGARCRLNACGNAADSLARAVSIGSAGAPACQAPRLPPH